jgi:hypothetical protein
MRLISFKSVNSRKTKALFRFLLRSAVQIDSRWEASSNQLVIRTLHPAVEPAGLTRRWERTRFYSCNRKMATRGACLCF